MQKIIYLASYYKYPAIACFLFGVFFSVNNANAQCTWDSAYYNGWETPGVADPYIIAGTTYGNTPKSYVAHTGTYSIYMNLENTIPAGTLFYDRPMNVCTGAHYRLSVWLTTTFASNLCNENVIITDSTGNDTLAITTTGLMAVGVWYNFVETFTATNSVIYFKLVTNVGGSTYNGNGDDLSMDDLYLQVCQSTEYDTVAACKPNNTVFNLFDSISPALAPGGTWTGASGLSGASLGTFNTGVNLSGTYNYSVQGLSGCPEGLAQLYVNNKVAPGVSIGNDTTLCNQASYLIDPVISGSLPDYLRWQDGNTTSTYNTTSTGLYWLRDSNSCGVAADSALITFIASPLPQSIGPADTVLCSGSGITLGLHAGLPSYDTLLWQNGTNGLTLQANSAGLYSLTITNQCGAVTDTSLIAFIAAPVPQSIGPPDTMLCPGSAITLGLQAALPPYDTLLWQNGTSGLTIQASTAGHYALTVTNQCGAVTDTSDVQFIAPLPASSLGPPDTSFCSGGRLLLAPSPVPQAASFLWQDGSTTDTLGATLSGLYILHVSNACASYSDSINVIAINAPGVFTIGNNESICAGGSITLLQAPAAPAGDSLVWQDGTTHTDSFVANAAGQYTLTEINQCGSRSASVDLTIQPLPTVVLDTVPVQCNVDSILVPALATNTTTYHWNTGAQDSSIYVSVSGNYAVTATNSCGSSTATVNVKMLTSPIRPFDDLTIDSCSGAQVVLDAGNPGSTYLWSNGHMTRTITASDSGLYYVTISDSGYCPVSDSVYVFFHQCTACKVAIPSAFTPNGDGRNDVFKPLFECTVDSYEMRIYDRWGELVFAVTDPANGWDGTFKSNNQPIGVYVYFLQYRNPGDTQETNVTGTITLLR